MNDLEAGPAGPSTSTRGRDWAAVRQALLEECRRPDFARVARYRWPQGDGRDHASIRFAEAVMRQLGGIEVDIRYVYDETVGRVLRVRLRDLLGQLTLAQEVVVRSPSWWDADLTQPRAWSGAASVLLAEDRAAENAAVSRVLRSLALRLVPPDLVEACLRVARATILGEAAEDLEAVRRRLRPQMAEVGLEDVELEYLLGHGLGEATAEECADLEALLATLRESGVSDREVSHWVRAEPSSERLSERFRALQERLRVPPDCRSANATVDAQAAYSPDHPPAKSSRYRA